MRLASGGSTTSKTDSCLAAADRQPGSGTSASVKLPHVVIVRAPGLLPMLYRPSELAQDLEVPESTLRDWLDIGLPHQRDERGHIWINGREFAEWVKASRRSSSSRRMADDEAYCFRCQRPVKLVKPNFTQRGKQMLLSSTCPNCGSTINRGSHNGQSKQLSTDKSLS
jgi:hypothetical protein